MWTKIRGIVQKLKLFWVMSANPDAGELRAGSVRSILTPATLLDATRHRVKDIGPAGKRFMYEAGQESGKEYASYVANIYGGFKDEKRFTEVAEQFARLSGWGQVEVVEADFNTARFTIELQNTIFSADVEEKTCEYVAGVMSGTATVIFDQDIDVREEQCVNEGQERCVFTMRPSDAFDSIL